MERLLPDLLFVAQFPADDQPLAKNNSLFFPVCRIIKMSSPNLNNIVILGCMFCYTSVVLLGLDARILSSDEHGYNCNVRYNFLSFILKKFPNDFWPTKTKKHLANDGKRNNLHLTRSSHYVLLSDTCI